MDSVLWGGGRTPEALVGDKALTILQMSPPGVAEPTDRELDAQSLRLWKNGSQRGFNQIVERYQKTLFHFIYRMVRDEDEARDLLQETFVRLHRSLASLREDKSIKSWLFRTANNLCVDYFRKHKPGRVTAVDHQAPETLAMIEAASIDDRSDPRPDEAACQNAQQEAILAAIGSLPQKQRMAMTLRSCEGLSMKEISDIMGCSEQTVGTTLFAARKRLSLLLRPVLNEVYGSAD